MAVFGLLKLDEVPTPMYDRSRDLAVLGGTIRKMLT